ncbi:hypothetical protein C823_004279 [Eubacterium plexicaudatum ASF492]|uniref:Membrane protein YczE n=1 Tax=Eubacterium plexicaudatum ASF492 TaxID=1235802 RepID=N2A5L7_9FIRM|nr:hypothetical protein C823_004279 [Eubacterium plexicaudatum ASF492]
MKSINRNKFLLAAAGILLVGIGIAFNAAAALGNDPIGIVYDGIRNTAGLSPQQLGMASNLVNIALVAAVFLLGRRYVNIGTFIYIIPYGTIVSLGGKLYGILFQVQTLPIRMLGAAIGCLLLYTGVAMFITADIGLDPFTGMVMIIRDKIGKEYGTVKVCFDAGCIILGFVLGGKLGIITILTALSAGPLIQLFANRFAKMMKTE